MNKLPKKVRSRIARSVLGIGTLEVRNSDRLDFPEVSVLAIQMALQAAFEEGIKFANRPKKVKEIKYPVVKGFTPSEKP